MFTTIVLFLLLSFDKTLKKSTPFHIFTHFYFSLLVLICLLTIIIHVLLAYPKAAWTRSGGQRQCAYLSQRHRNGDIARQWHDEDMSPCLRAPPTLTACWFSWGDAAWHSPLGAGFQRDLLTYVGYVHLQMLSFELHLIYVSLKFSFVKPSC